MTLHLVHTQPGVVTICDDDVVLTFATLKPEGGEVWINGPRPHLGDPLATFRQVARDFPDVFVTRIREATKHLDDALEASLTDNWPSGLDEAETEARAILALINLLKEERPNK